MKARAGSGWQTLLADLSIILFMVTASAVSEARDGDGSGNRAGAAASSRSEPLALYRMVPGAPPFARWLAGQSPDPRQQLTLVAHYGPGGQAAALAATASLLREAGAAGAGARLVVEPGEGEVIAQLAYDAPLAQALQGREDTKESSR